jgi:Sulfotransferase domain
MAEAPHFFIVGSAKCGTTALFEYLCQHPAVYMPAMKEPKYFCSDLKSVGGVYTYDEYMSLFASAPPGAVSGEASTWYVYSEVAIARIMAHNPNARIIMMLRYPVDAAHSLYMAAWGYQHENMASFEDAWRVQEARLSGSYMPPNWPDARTLQYGAMYRYAAQVRRLMNHVPETQRHFIVYEEFFADPQRHYEETLRFLNLAPHPDAKFSIVNPAIGPRSTRLDGWLRKPPMWLKRLYSPVRPLVGAVGLKPVQLIRKLNSVPTAKAAIRPEFRDELARYFADDIDELESLLGRRLWRGLFQER